MKSKHMKTKKSPRNQNIVYITIVLEIYWKNWFWTICAAFKTNYVCHMTYEKYFYFAHTKTEKLRKNYNVHVNISLLWNKL